MEIWFSDGEPFITAESEKIVMDLQKIIALDEDGELFLLDEGRIQDPAEELPSASIKNWTLVKGVDYYDFEGLESKAEVTHDIRYKIEQQEPGDIICNINLEVEKENKKYINKRQIYELLRGERSEHR